MSRNVPVPLEATQTRETCAFGWEWVLLITTKNKTNKQQHSIYGHPRNKNADVAELFSQTPQAVHGIPRVVSPRGVEASFLGGKRPDAGEDDSVVEAGWESSGESFLSMVHLGDGGKSRNMSRPFAVFFEDARLRMGPGTL